MTTPPRSISIVIPTYNRRERLQRVLRSLDEQTCGTDRFEVVVISDGSTDGTNEHLATARYGFALVTEVQDNAGPAAARNRGVALAGTPLVLFVDDDVVATPTLVAEHLASHDRLGPDHVVIGPMINPPDFTMQPWVEWEQAMLYKQYDAIKAGRLQPTHRQFYTGNASVSRARLVEAGGFDTRFRRAEDVELSYRLARTGLRFVFNADAVGHHYAERSFDSWLRNAHDYGVNEVVFGISQGQDPILDRVRWEYHERHPLVRSVARFSIAVPGMGRAVPVALRCAARLGQSARLPGLHRLALSALFNTAYYLGIADELGGWRPFRQAMKRGGNL